MLWVKMLRAFSSGHVEGAPLRRWEPAQDALGAGREEPGAAALPRGQADVSPREGWTPGVSDGREEQQGSPLRNPWCLQRRETQELA